MPTGLTYQDYLANANYGQISGEGSPNPISEAQWNAMPPQEQWSLIGGRVAITPDDSRYADLKPQVGGEQGRNIWLSPDRPPDNGLLDGAQLASGNGWFAHSEDNQSPQWQSEMDISDTAFRNFLILASLMVGGAAASGAFSSGAAGTAASGAGELGLTAGGTAGIGAGATGAGALDLGALGTAGTAAGTAAAANGTTATSGLTGLLGNNAGNLARLIAAGAMANGSGSSSAGTGTGTGDPNDPNSIIEAMANANRVNHSTPFGSRQWSQDEGGRWSVADTLNPAEQRNFEGVQGLNSNVTQMAAQRLAQLMAGTGRQRADRPLMFNGRPLGG